MASSYRNYSSQDDDRSRYGPRKASDILAQLMARRGYARVQATSDLHEKWEQAVGKKFATRTRPGEVRSGVLQVLVKNSAVMQEMTFARKRLIKKLQEVLPNEGIQSLKFKVGAID